MSLDVGALYERHAHQVAGFVRGRMTGAAAIDADDVAHLVWERALRAAGRYRPDSHPMAWLLTIARNAVTDYYRRAEWRLRSRAVSADALLDEHHPTRPDEYASTRDDLRAALDDLTPSQRQVVELFYWQELPFAAIAERIGTTENGVKKLAIRARARLRRYLEGAA